MDDSGAGPTILTQMTKGVHPDGENKLTCSNKFWGGVVRVIGVVGGIRVVGVVEVVEVVGLVL